jgi:hypothetical protein
VHCPQTPMPHGGSHDDSDEGGQHNTAFGEPTTPNDHNSSSNVDNSVGVHVLQILFQFQPGRELYMIIRLQIPLTLAYAVTFNGCQGMTVMWLSLDLCRSVFSHGQLYCAMLHVSALWVPMLLHN